MTGQRTFLLFVAPLAAVLTMALVGLALDLGDRRAGLKQAIGEWVIVAQGGSCPIDVTQRDGWLRISDDQVEFGGASCRIDTVDWRESEPVGSVSFSCGRSSQSLTWIFRVADNGDVSFVSRGSYGSICNAIAKCSKADLWELHI
ncbi:MAG: hypothetical protein AAGC79_03335 [Pseudomonadota bacterium]